MKFSSLTVFLPRRPSSPWKRWPTGSGSIRSWTTRFLPSWTSTWSRWKQTVPRWSTCAASSPPSTSRWPPPASVDTTPVCVGKGEETEPRTTGRMNLTACDLATKQDWVCLRHKDASSHLALLSACSSVPSLWPVLLVAFRLGGGWERAGKMCFSSMKWSVFPCDSSSLTQNSEAILQPQRWGSCRKSCVFPQCWEPAPTTEAIGQINPTCDMCHQPWGRKVWRQTLTCSFGERGDEDRILPVAAAWGPRIGTEGPGLASLGLLHASGWG